jgi:hypothetical protein
MLTMEQFMAQIVAKVTLICFGLHNCSKILPALSPFFTLFVCLLPKLEMEMKNEIEKGVLVVSFFIYLRVKGFSFHVI